MPLLVRRMHSEELLHMPCGMALMDQKVAVPLTSGPLLLPERAGKEKEEKAKVVEQHH